VVEHDINRPLQDCDKDNGVIKLAMMMLAATWYRDKEATVEGGAMISRQRELGYLWLIRAV